jgi:4-hydroxy-tetrahydrodipicolinate synthase
LKFEGIYTPAITPLNAGGQIGRAAFANILESLIEAKVHGIVVGGSTGEYYAQSAQERFDLGACAKEVIGALSR